MKSAMAASASNYQQPSVKEKTLDELKANITEAIELVLEVNEAKSKKDQKMIIDIPAN